MESGTIHRLAVIAGTGVDEQTEFTEAAPMSVSTRFGEAQVVRCEIDRIKFVFLPRHGPTHSLPPHLVNHRANIAALKLLGVERVVGVCSVGSLMTQLQPGSFAILGDFVDLTRRTITTYFDEPGVVAHTDFSRPYCPEISDALAGACEAEHVGVTREAVYVGVDGPRYETPAEVRLYAAWGGHVVGMTGVPEAILAREAGLCYGALAVVTNFAAGLSPTPLTHEEVRRAMAAAGPDLRRILARALRSIPASRACACASTNGISL